MAAGHVRVELAPRHAALAHVDRLVGQDGDQRVEELRGLDGLVEVRGEALALGARLATAERGEEHQGQRGARRLLPDRPRQGHAVHLRHVHVEDADVEALVGLDPRERLEGRSGGPRPHPPGVEVRGEDAPVGGVVVHHEHALAAKRRLHAAQVAAGRTGRLGGRRADREAEVAAGGRSVPTSLVTSIRPPISSVSRWLIARPRPVPP